MNKLKNYKYILMITFFQINLKYGMKGVPLEMMRETCTACAGSMILEMAALSRLTGESVFEVSE